MKIRNAERGAESARHRPQGDNRNGGKQEEDAHLPLQSPISAFRVPRSGYHPAGDVSQTRLRISAFTLVEILASLLFLAIAVPAIVGALGLASRTSEVAERGSLAGNLAENKLNEMLVDSAWQSAAQSNGDFGADYPFYHWQMSTQSWTGASSLGTGTTSTVSTGTNGLSELNIEVFYPVQGSEHSVRLTTLVGTSTSTTTGTTTTGTSTTR